MDRRNIASVVASIAIASLLAPISLWVHAQTSQPATKSEASAPDKPYDWKASFAEYKVGKVPRTADGKPDLQGIWSRTTLVPLERPLNQDKKEIDSATAAKIEDAAHRRTLNLRIEPTDTPPGEKTTDAYNTFWRDGYFSKIPMTSLRTSQIVDPPDGRIPPLTKEALQKRYKAAMKSDRLATGPEDRPLDSRCVRPLGVGPAFSGTGGPGGQETTLEIIQNPKMVVVRVEALESLMIYLDGRPRPPENIHMYLGASRGHWEGDTLVVETTNFTDSGVRDGSGRMHLTERWKRLDDLHMLYGFTMDDPGTWTKPWSIEFVLWRLTDQEELVEYACHEGNVGLEFTLSAARSKEQEEAEQQAKDQGNRQ